MSARAASTAPKGRRTAEQAERAPAAGVSPAAASEAMGIEMMDQMVHLEYVDLVSPPVLRYGESLLQGKLVGQQCPKCSLVYVPPRGYCPIDTIVLDERHEIELRDHGVITNYTVVTPVQYYGQEETEPFVRASVLLDGPGGMLNLQDVLEIPVDEVRAGMRVEAVWAPAKERELEGLENRGWGSTTGCLLGWRPTGEPDVPREAYADKVF